MENIRPNRAGLALAVLMAGMHLAWSILVAAGWAQTVMDFIFRLHFIKLTYAIEKFDINIALLLIVITASIGYIVGWVFAVLWNKLHK